MATDNWPATGRKVPKDIAKHAARLKAELDWLHASFGELYTKLEPQFSTTSQTRPAVAAPVATQPTPAVNPVSAAPKHNTDRGPVRAPKRAAPARQKEIAKSVSSEDTDSDTGTDTSEGEEEESDKKVNARDGQEIIENEDVNSGEGSSEDSSDKGDATSDTEEEGSQEVVREQDVSNIARRDGKNFTVHVNLSIEQQATVNRLEGMTVAELSACLSSLLKKYLRKQQLSSRSVQIVHPVLSDDGHVNLDLQAETHEALQQLFDSGNWGQDLESLICPTYVTTCKVRMHKVEIKTVRLQNRKEKAATIRLLANANHKNHANNKVERVGPIIRDIYWPKDSSQKGWTSLTIEFLDPEDANHALKHGLFWQHRRYRCEREEKNHRLLRCIKCQAYGHLDDNCSAPQRCGKCAGNHPTAACMSKIVKCGSCGHGHVAGSNICPAKSEARQQMQFPAKSSPHAIKPAAEAQETPSPHVRHSISTARTQTETSMPSPVSLDAANKNNESESEHLLREANPSPEDYASVKRELDDLRRMVAALQPKSPSRTKRRADEAFAGGAEAESSYKCAIPVKRIKKEQPSREGSIVL